MTTSLDAIRVHARRRSLGRASQRVPIASVVVHIFQVESVNVSREVPKVKALACLFKQYVKSRDHGRALDLGTVFAGEYSPEDG